MKTLHSIVNSVNKDYQPDSKLLKQLAVESRLFTHITEVDYESEEID